MGVSVMEMKRSPSFTMLMFALSPKAGENRLDSLEEGAAGVGREFRIGDAALLLRGPVGAP